MSALNTELLAEAVGPIVVKEVRQGLRARVFGICFGLLLTLCLTVALIAAAEVHDNMAQALGPRYLTLFLGGLGVICFFVIPYTAYRSMTREREEETWVLLALTGLSSRRIVRGKVASALTQAVLYSSAGAPFMVFSYFLNGVDLPTLLLEVGFASAWAVFLTCLAVALGTEGHSRLGRAGVHFVVLALLGAATIAGITFGGAMAQEGARWFEEDAFRIFAIAFPIGLFTTALLLIEGAAAGLSLTSESSVKAVRWVIVLQQGVGIAGTYLGVSLSAAPQKGVSAAASVISAIFLVVIGVFLVSERDGFPRVDRAARSWQTAGALRGWKLVMGLLLLDGIAWAGLYKLTPYGLSHYDTRIIGSQIAAPLYVALYLSLAVLLGRLTVLRKLGEPIATRVAFLALVAAGTIFPPVIALMSLERVSAAKFNHLNPFIGMVNFLDRSDWFEARRGLVYLSFLCLIASIGAFAVLKRRDKERNT
jgi:hypothetical protein